MSDIVVRPATLADLPALRAFLAGLKPASLHTRFWSDFLDLDDAANEAATAAGVVALDGPRVVGHAMLGAVGPRAVELAVEVADAWHGEGIGTRLVRILVEAARADGRETLVADVKPGNRPMLRLLMSLGLPLDVREHPTHVRVTVSL